MTLEEAQTIADQAAADGWTVLGIHPNVEFDHDVSLVGAHNPVCTQILIRPTDYAFHMQRLAQEGITPDDIRGSG